VNLLVQIAEPARRIHRGRLDIIADILNTSLSGVKKTYLMYRCNLSFKQLKHYLDFMFRKGLLHVVTVRDDDSNPGLLETTDKGKEFLRNYKALKALMK
jgi:predicted transcriptional regulator